MYGHDYAHTGRSPANGPLTANKVWSYPLGVRAQSNASPVVGSDGTVYVPSEQGFFAINPNGTLKWQIWSSDFTVTRLTPVIAEDGTIYITRWLNPGDPGWPGHALYALNPANGNTLWSYITGDVSQGSPTIGADGTIYIGSATTPSSIYAINPNGTLKWQWDSGNGSWIESSPAIGSGGAIYFHHNGLGLVALTSGGQFSWSRAGLGGVWNSPSVGADGTIYIGDTDGYFHALNPDGTDKWQAPVVNWMYNAASAISADGTTIYRGDNGGLFYAFRSSGSVQWQYDTGIPGSIDCVPALAANNAIYFTQGSSSGYLYALRASDGAFIWSYQIGSSSSSPALAADGTLYALGRDGLGNAVLYAFR